jgi:hypothetical protein
MTTPAPMLHGWEHAHRGPCPDAGGEETRIFPDPSFRQCVVSQVIFNDEITLFQCCSCEVGCCISFYYITAIEFKC